MTYDYAVIGGGIVGLATAHALSAGRPGSSILVLEKEPHWALHQTGRNSGVIHSGIYYRAGTLKARMAVAGNASMAAFCREHGIPHRMCGKLIVATEEREVEPLRNLERNAAANGVAAEWLDAAGARAFEPEVAAIAALRVPSTGVVDYRSVCAKLVSLLGSVADLRIPCRFESARDDGATMVLETSMGTFRARTMVNCAGLFSDRVATASGVRPDVRIVPFRGEYYSVKGESAARVRSLIYPVPNPDFPFLGVHLTRSVDGHVHAGPNAVLALSREGYDWLTVSPRDLLESLTYGGFHRLAGRYWREGLREMARSLSRRRFADSVRRLVPAIAEMDLTPSQAGVRAQALTASGALADDFVVIRGRRAVHVCNAPSPAATAALEIGAHVAAIAAAEE